MFYGEVFKALNKAKVKYVVAGGVAVVLHGYHRFTQDLDLIVFLEEKNLEKLFDALKKIKYMPKVPVTKEQFKDKNQRKNWEKEKGMIVFSFVKRGPPFSLIDMLIKHPIRFDLLYKNRVNVRVENIVVPILAVNHLIRIKQKAGRDIDLNDIVQLEEIKRMRKRMLK